MDLNLLKQLVGKWQGSCRTWFEPDVLADESELHGEFVRMLADPIVRHTYVGQLKGKPRHGEEWIAFNTVTNRAQTTWVDDFHMNYAILISKGEVSSESGIDVFGEYDVGPGEPRWGWRTVYQMPEPDRLVVTAYNVEPGGKQAKAVEVDYRRVG